MTCKYKTDQGCRWVFEKISEWRHLPSSICKDEDNCKVPETKTEMKKSGCCGKAKNILRGFAALAELKLTNNDPPEFAQKRIEICLKCDHRTWLNVMKWGIGFIKDGDLPVNHIENPYHVMWCSKCKCCITAKALVESEICPMDKWDKETEIEK